MSLTLAPFLFAIERAPNLKPLAIVASTQHIMRQITPELVALQASRVFLAKGVRGLRIQTVETS